ncbi:MAG: hypothetical protein HYV63_32310, partial [Candidatus Schekmanbacteria bacterium]|nr:hypothetical protein [Candidatus Schekmanbacteria bacterium]
MLRFLKWAGESWLGVLELLACAGAVYWVVRFALPGAHRDPLTAIMISVVTVAWFLYWWALRRWWNAGRDWLEREPDSAGGVPQELSHVADAVSASPVELGGRTWRITSAAEALATGRRGAADLALPELLGTGQTVLISLGLMGTFLGLTIGLMQAVPKLTGAEHVAGSSAIVAAGVPAPASGDPQSDDAGTIEGMQEGMTDLLGGARLAFAKSLAGILFAMLWALRLRSAEARRGERLAAWARMLDSRFPLLTERHAHLHLISLVGELAGSESKRAEARAEKLEQRVSALAEDVRRKVEELGATLQQLAESLPTKIGSSTSEPLLRMMAPHFATLVEEMKRLREGAGRQISDAVFAQADAEVAGLKHALGEIVVTLRGLPSDYQARMSEVSQGVGRAMDTAGSTVNGAAAELGQVSHSLRDTVIALGSILIEVKEAAGGVAGAGDQVRERLDGVAAPLVELRPVLVEAADAFRASESALCQHAD